MRGSGPRRFCGGASASLRWSLQRPVPGPPRRDHAIARSVGAGPAGGAAGCRAVRVGCPERAPLRPGPLQAGGGLSPGGSSMPPRTLTGRRVGVALSLSRAWRCCGWDSAKSRPRPPPSAEQSENNAIAQARRATSGVHRDPQTAFARGERRSKTRARPPASAACSSTRPRMAPARPASGRPIRSRTSQGYVDSTLGDSSENLC
jgi:hypothetical protein